MVWQIEKSLLNWIKVILSLKAKKFYVSSEEILFCTVFRRHEFRAPSKICGNIMYEFVLTNNYIIPIKNHLYKTNSMIDCCVNRKKNASTKNLLKLSLKP